MKNILLLALCLIAILVSVAHAEAARPPIKPTSALGSVLDIEGANSGGSGCVGGSAVVKALSSTVIQIKTPNMITKAKAGKLQRSACSIAIPVKLKSNEALMVESALVTGDVSLKKNASVTTAAEVFHPESSGHKFSRIDSGKKISKILLKGGHIATGCGDSTLLRVNLSQIVDATKAASSKAKVSGALLQLHVVSCL
jgi:hypothetical protein